MADITVRENPAENRFEITVDGALAGFTAYELRGETYALMHTEIGEEFGGQGLGSTLIRSTLDDLRGRGKQVLPYCPFVRKFMVKNPDYAELVPPSHRSIFGLKVA
ncbi:GNAT family N-acetyltransferase [Spongisporangium articulatum]|uniref:GNAT family N-acetyltransferase n=1 Tax=Spongisporangium articulatum TaxID=3362603 RepID=A0ABW8ANX0_9ACTN